MREEFVREQRVAQPRFHVGARHAGGLQRLFELSVGGDVVLLFESHHRVFHFGVVDADAEAIGAIFDEQLADDLIDQTFAKFITLRRDFVGRRGLIDFGQAFAKAFHVLRARDDAVADANDDCFDELGGAKRAGGEADGNSENDFLHHQYP